MKFKHLLIGVLMSASIYSCNSKQEETKVQVSDFNYVADEFADVKILRYQVPNFDQLSLNQKLLVYYLNQAAIEGRDIVFDQNFKYNLTIRRTLENIYQTYNGDKTTEDWNNFVTYLKRIWHANGIHHNYSQEKFVPNMSQEYFTTLIANSDQTQFPLSEGQTIEQFTTFITPVLYDPAIYSKRVATTGKDVILGSCVNFYEGVNQNEVEAFYNKLEKEQGDKLSLGLNSKLVKRNGKIEEQVYKIGGMYNNALVRIVDNLTKAMQYAENDAQRKTIEQLIEYYKTGSLQTWDDCNVTWVNDTLSSVDFVNGFIEVYTDPMGRKATFEAVVDFKDAEASKRTELISTNAQWFEDNSPVEKQFKKEKVKGVSAKIINVAMLGGDCYPTPPIGINLPNANWIRKEHGSKSVSLVNITDAHAKSALTGRSMLDEFAYSDEEKKLSKEHGTLAGNLHTDLHECLGHGSGQLAPGVSDGSMKNFHSPLEEARADLFALYYVMDNKLVELGVIPTLDVAKAEYASYIRNGLMTQLVRIDEGKQIEQAHMRARSLISHWAYEMGKADNVIEKKVENGKTYFVVNDYAKLRGLFGDLLNKIQTIKSTGNYEEGKKLVETYAINIDPEIHKEVKARYADLKLKPYSGFMNPEYELVKNDKGEVVDVKVSYPDDYIKQNLEYSKNNSPLPNIN